MFRISRFAELLKLLPRRSFDQAVQSCKADQHCKSFSSWRHLVTMLYLQLSGQSSLRTVSVGFNAQPQHHYHLDCRAVRRSTLADANAKQSRAQAFEQLARELMVQARPKLRDELTQMLHVLDSTSITLKGWEFDEWVKHTRSAHSRGIKLHVLFGTAQQAPLAASSSEATLNDLDYAREMELESEAIYVFDKAYCDYSWWWKIEQAGSKFVTRFKVNANLQVVRERRVAKDAQEIILKDQVVVFANKHPRGGRRNPYTQELRRIEVSRAAQGKEPLVLATNDLKSSALRIAQRYKARWQIELFFKWIKQHLRIKRFVGRSYSAVRIQIFTALIAYLLVALHAKVHKITKSLWLLLAELSSTLFQRAELEWLRHQRWREQRADFQSRQVDIFA